MIKKLKTRFIVLAMVSLAVLLSVIVAGMNIINYRKVVSDADIRLDALEETSERLLMTPDGAPFGDRDSWFDMEDFFDFIDDDYIGDPDDSPFLGRRGGGHPMTRDEAEESRFFVVALSEDGTVQKMNIERIASIDSAEAEEYAKKAFASGEEAGFIKDFRYSVDNDGSSIRITFLDCGRVLGSFRDFLRASILMSLIGLLAVFFVILYFAGRIVRPVAESYEKQKRFITDAGHEIKTPLAIIKANIDLMDMELDKKRIDRSELRENLGDIDDQVNRLTGLTNDLVYLSRMEEADSSLVMTEVPLSDIVAETAASFEPLAEEQGKAIATDIEPMVSVQGSTKELEKLLSIILDNAIKYSIPPRVIDCGE
ncbi:MAG: HAMP domain-containing histidine kinase, partial [Mogibacterium sp.]|nr:HAMP domain-containing histidine kinase [Mogibacterium sp.]